jgi:hypothetical protein
LIFAFAIAAMAIGVIFGKRRITGSCGGLANMRDSQGNISCALCTNPREQCRDADRWSDSPVVATDEEPDDDHRPQ